MTQTLSSVAIVVRDYDEAIAFYTQSLRFTLVEDTLMENDKRWVVVSPPGSTGSSVLLAKAVTEEQKSRIGDQTGGRVFLFLHTDDFWDDYNYMKSHGVHFLEEPREEVYGTVVVFLDLYGNKWDLIERH